MTGVKYIYEAYCLSHWADKVVRILKSDPFDYFELSWFRRKYEIVPLGSDDTNVVVDLLKGEEIRHMCRGSFLLFCLRRVCGYFVDLLETTSCQTQW